MKYSHAMFGVFFASVVFFFGAQSAFASGCEPQELRATNYGQSGTHVKALQTCLLSAGFNIPAGASGYFGAQTKVALQSFYRTVLKVSDWDGRSIGPKGRTLLAERAKGTVVNVPVSSSGGAVGLKRIASQTELTKYLELSRGARSQASLGLSGTVAISSLDSSKFENSSFEFLAPPALISNDVSSSKVTSMAPVGVAGDEGSDVIISNRVSETNVQVAGIDEPDIVKTDGKTIFFRRSGYTQHMCMDCGSFPTPYSGALGVTAITAFPLSSLGIASDAITERGEMLLVKDKHILIVLASDKIVAYDVADPTKPVKKWTNELKNNTQVVSARLKQGTMYLVTSTYLNTTTPCPIMPMMRGGVSLAIPCGDIWAPVSYEPSNVTYTLFAMDPVTGKENMTTTILGNSSQTTITMSENNIYLAYRMQNEEEKVFMNFLKDETKGLLSDATIARIRTVDGYDISPSSKMSEIGSAIEKEMATLSRDARLKFENELENRMKNYLSAHLRETDRTTILRIPLSTLSVASSSVIPGHLLNQFAMDEWNGNLRVAVTVGERWGMAGDKMVNDVYVLGESGNTIGSILDLGVTERIYAARFIGSRGYLVTFRQTDPFYVLDLSIPSAPKMVGELKIPGYSAYLEPLSETRILGVGREGSGVKLSIFDVSNPTLPTEKAKYTLKDSWSEVESNHHAFLRDEKHKVFFIPGGQGGYVFSYTGDTLALNATVAGYQVKRAVYIEDNLYIIGEDKITVIDEGTWKEVKTLELK